MYHVNRVYLDVVRATAAAAAAAPSFSGRAAREWVFEHAAVACQLADARSGDRVSHHPYAGAGAKSFRKPSPKARP